MFGELWPEIAPGVLAAVTPIVIAAAKRLVGHIPSVWLPIAAPILGVLLDWLNGWATGASLPWWQAALAGLAGVGLREVIDQAKKVAR